jgi:HK97 family phage major capsid protein
MEKELLEIAQKKAELRSKVEAAKSMDDLNALKAELEELDAREQVLTARAAMASKLATGNNAAAIALRGKKAEGEKPDLYSSLEYRSAFMNYVLRGDKAVLEMRADGVTNTADVGAVIPTTIINQIIEKLEATGMIIAEVTKTALKGGVSYPTSAVKPVATWVAEGAGSDKQKKTVGQISFTWHKLRCAVAMTLETTVESMAVFEQTLIQNMAEAMLIAIEKSILTGDGNSQPKGILTETVDEDKVVTVSGGLTYGDFIDAEAALDIAYENDAVYCMTKKTFLSLIAQTDSNGQPVARVNFGVAGKPERTVLGRRVILTNYLPSLDANTEDGAIVGLLFNFKDYVLNTAYQMGLKRYEDNETDDQVMKSIWLADGKVISKESLVVFKASKEA